MDPRTNRRSSTASSADSLVLYLNGGPPPTNGDRTGKRRRRACPVLALLGLLLHFLTTGCGVAICVIIVRFGLQVTTAGTLDLVGRILVFVASCMGIFYVLMHACAAREKYIRSHGNAHVFGFFTVAVAIIIMRLAVPVWIAAVVITALVAASKGFALENGVQGNVIWIQLGIACLGLLSLFLMIVITERTDRPFATSLFSKKRFILGMDGPVKNRTDTFEMSVSRQGFRNDEKKGTTVTHEDVVTKNDGRDSVYDRSLIVTPTSADEASSVPTVPTLPTMPEWRQRRDAALRTALRADNARSQAVPSPLTTVYGPATPPSRDSVKQYGSHFSWRPPTRDRDRDRDRDSTFPPHESQQMEEYRNNWPPTVLPQGSKSPKSPNRASAPPPSQPPNVPLPPLMPLSESSPLAETANEVEAANTVEYAAASKSSTDAASPPLHVNSTSTLETQPASTADQEAAIIPDDEQPVDEAPKPRGRRPALPSLEKLSARAAARNNKTSMLVREQEMKPGPSIDNSTDDATKTESSRSTPEVAETTQPESKPRDYKTSETDDSGFESEEDTGPEEPRRSRHRSRSLLRSNTGGSRLVRNFSRPRVPSSLLRSRRPSEGHLPAMGLSTVGRRISRRDSNAGSSFSSLTQQWRRSRSMPAARDRRADNSTPETEPEPERERSIVLEVDPSTFQPTVPILQAAPVRQQNKPFADTQQKKVIPPAPRFSPFPSAATSMAPEKKVKGLGQGSLRRLEARVAQWREGVDPTEAERVAQAELDAQQRRQIKEEIGTMQVGRTSIDEQSGRRPSMESGRGRSRGAPTNKLSREKSLTGRARRAAQNF